MWTSSPVEGFGHTEESFSNIYPIQTRTIDLFKRNMVDQAKHSAKLEKIKQKKWT